MTSSGRVILLGQRKPEDEPFLKKHKDKETTQGFADDSHEVRVKLLEKKKSDETSLIVAKETVVGLDETSSDFDEDFLLLRKRRTVYVANLSHQTQISDIVSFFEEGVVHVRLILHHEKGKHVGFVEFASVVEARTAVKKKNGEVLHGNKIIVYETPGFVEEAAEHKKTLFLAHFSRQTTDIVSDVIGFFEDVGEVVRVRLVLDSQGSLVGCGFVEFASAEEANKALQEKNGEYLHGDDDEIYLDMADREATYLPPPRYCLDHKVWYQEEDYLQLEEDACYVEEVLLIANLSPQTTEIMHIVSFFEDVGTVVVSVRLVVNSEGKHVGFGFVEFASAYYAEKALEEKNGEYLHDHKILLMRGFDKTTPEAVSSVRRSKTLFVDNLSSETEISHIISILKDVGEVVHVRLFVDHHSRLLGYGFVEFASADEAEKALEKSNGEYLDDNEIILDVVDKGAEYLWGQSMYCIDHKVWYQEDDDDETPDFSEEVAVREKTVFVDNIPNHVGMASLTRNVKFAGEVVRVRLVVDGWGERVGCCFVELPSAEAAKKAVEKKKCSGRYLNVAVIDTYPFRLTKYKDLAEKLWYEDNLLRKHLPRGIVPNNKPNPWEQFSGKRTTFCGDE